MDLDGLRDGLQAAVPFNRLLGLEYRELQPGRAVIALPDRPELGNHVATQHAGALFTAAEAASGAAFVAAFAEGLADLTPLVRSAEISYQRPARGVITATATVAEARQTIADRLADGGRVRFEVDVRLEDAAGDQVATVTVHWDVRRRAASAHRQAQKS